MEATTDTTKAKGAYTKRGYIVPAGEENDVHVVIGRQSTGRESGRLVVKDNPSTQILNPKDWETFRKIWPSQGWIFLETLHLPVGSSEGFPEHK